MLGSFFSSFPSLIGSKTKTCASSARAGFCKGTSEIALRNVSFLVVRTLSFLGFIGSSCFYPTGSKVLELCLDDG
jgi:hypothetical protein